MAASEEPLGSNAQGMLKSIIDRINRLEDDRACVATDIREVYAEAKDNGFDTKVLRRLVRLIRQDRAKRQEEEAILDLYLTAIGEQ